MEALTEITGKTSALAVWNGTEAVVVEQIPSPHQVKHTAAIGTRYNLYESSSVRVFLAELPFRKVQEFLDDGTITHSAESGLSNGYLAHLTEVRGRGLAVNDGYTTF